MHVRITESLLYNHAKTNVINNAVSQFNWQRAFSRKDVHSQVVIFNQTLLNIFCNYVPNKLITCNDRDPAWMTSNIRNKFNSKNVMYRTFIRNGKNHIDYTRPENIRQEISNLVLEAKEKHYHWLSKKLNNPSQSAKSYWSILKSLLKFD